MSKGAEPTQDWKAVGEDQPPRAVYRAGIRSWTIAVAHRTYRCRVRLLSAKGRAFQVIGSGRSDFQRTGRSHISL